MQATNQTVVISMKTWMRQATLKFFTRNPDMMVMPKLAHISQESVLKIMSHSFEAVSRDAYYITVAARSILSDRLSRKVYKEEELFKAEQTIAKTIESATEWLDRQIGQAELKLQAANIDPDQIRRNTKCYDAPCTSSTARLYIDVLVKGDIYLNLVNMLWIAGELSNSEQEAAEAKVRIERDVKNRLLEIARECSRQFLAIHRICIAVMDERNVARAEQSARAKAQHASKSSDKAAARTQKQGRAENEIQRAQALSEAQSELQAVGADEAAAYQHATEGASPIAA
jgi:hypothetical protein